MSTFSLFSPASLHTMSGATVAVMLIVQLIKGLPILKKFPTKWVAVVTGIVFFIVIQPNMPTTVINWVSIIMNGLLSGSAAIGSWHIIQENLSNFWGKS